MRNRLRCMGALVVVTALAAACGTSGPKAVKPGPPTTTSNGVQLIDSGGHGQAPPSAAAVRAAAQGEGQFAFSLYHVLAAAKGNVALAPSSIATVLGMIAAGARGATEQQMVDALHVALPAGELHAAIGGLAQEFSKRAREGVTLSEVDQAWLQLGQSVLAPYSDTLAGSYDAPLATIDFSKPDAAAATINGWFADHTHGKITKLIDGSDLTAAALVLTDAVYLDAKWAHAFDPKLTAPAPFHLADGTTASVPTMHFSDPPTLGYASGARWQAVALPYQGNQLEMDVIVPADLHAFEASLDRAALEKVLAALRPNAVALSMPRFDARVQTDLVDPLKQMGIRDAFSQTAADLSGIDGARDLYVSDVKHEVVVHVDERGTVAAGATAGIVSAVSAPLLVPMRVDKPFVYVVRDRTTGAILFLGRVTDPR